jgi:hypothetical protein
LQWATPFSPIKNAQLNSMQMTVKPGASVVSMLLFGGFILWNKKLSVQAEEVAVFSLHNDVTILQGIIAATVSYML